MFKISNAGGVAAALVVVTMGAQAQTAQWHFEGAISGLQALNATRSGLNPVSQLGDLALGQTVSADVRVDLAANNYVDFEVTVHGASDILFAKVAQPFSSTNLPGPGVGQFMNRVQAPSTVSRPPVDIDFHLQLLGSALAVGAYNLQDIQNALINHSYSSFLSDSGVGEAFCGKCYMGQVQVDFSSVSVSPVPEPSTRAVWGLGLAAMMAGLAARSQRRGAQALVA
jgi:hypothetical protein